MCTYSVTAVTTGTRKTYVLRVRDQPMPVHYLTKREITEAVDHLEKEGYMEDASTKTGIERG